MAWQIFAASASRRPQDFLLFYSEAGGSQVKRGGLVDMQSTENVTDFM